jgi:hypothetical protein
MAHWCDAKGLQVCHKSLGEEQKEARTKIVDKF